MSMVDFGAAHWEEDDDSSDTLPEIRNCPRCGRDAEWEYNCGDTAILCSACGYYQTLDGFDSEDQLANWWNERPLEDALRERIAELEAPKRWQPVDGYIDCLPDENNTVRRITSRSDAIHFLIPGLGAYTGLLPPGYALCKLVEASE